MEDGDRFTPLRCLVDEPAHHLGQDPATSMARCHPDPGDGRRADVPAAGDGQARRFGCGGTDPCLAIDRADEPIELPELSVELEHGIGVVIGERLRGRGDVRPKRLDIAGRLSEFDRVVMHAGILPRG